jgi:hypothetical protein
MATRVAFNCQCGSFAIKNNAERHRLKISGASLAQARRPLAPKSEGGEGVRRGAPVITRIEYKTHKMLHTVDSCTTPSDPFGATVAGWLRWN